MKSSVAAVLGGASTALAAVRGFNYAAQGQSQQQFESSFKTAAGLPGASDFTSARLYTMIQEGTTNSPIDAIPAAIDTKTTLLLGVWASEAQSAFDNEITALKSAISQYGSDLAGLTVGISVGSEDLYRTSATGLANDPNGVGQTPDTLVDYIGQVRTAIQGTALSGVPVGHVDTWNAFVNGSNSAVISACDFLGLDEYPYYQTTDSNGIENGGSLFFQAYDKVAAVASGKQIWVTEAGWPTSGPVSNQAVASVDNAEEFWQDVACELEDRNINFWWYILEDSGDASGASFGVSKGGVPLYNLACNGTSTKNSTTSNSNNSSNSTTTTGYHNSTSSATKTASATGTGATGASATHTGSGSGSSSSSSGSSASGSASGSSPSVSAYGSGAGKVEGTVAGLVLAAVIAALAL